MHGEIPKQSHVRIFERATDFVSGYGRNVFAIVTDICYYMTV